MLPTKLVIKTVVELCKRFPSVTYPAAHWYWYTGIDTEAQTPKKSFLKSYKTVLMFFISLNISVFHIFFHKFHCDVICR